MPRIGTPEPRIASSISGASSTSVLSGPPDNISAAGLRADSALHGASCGTISQYTPSSRVRRAISWLYCAPKSRIKTVGGAPLDLCCANCCLHRGIVVWFAGHFRHDLSVCNLLVFADHDDRARQQPQLADQQAVV